MNWLLEPLQYEFIVRAMLAALLVGVVCSILGVYIVLRGMAFLGDAMAHTILPGVVVAFLLGWPLAVGALVMGVLTALGIGALTERTALKEDTAIGVIFAGFFALGVALLSARGDYSIDLAHFLFGNLLGVSPGDLLLMAMLGAAVLLTIYLFYKEFLVLSFDPLLAETLRLPVRFLNYLLLLLLAVTIVVALQVVGVALMLAVLVTPAAAASFLTHRLPAMMAIAATIGAFSAVAGVYLSYHLNIAAGPAVVLVATLLFLLALLLAGARGRRARSADAAVMEAP
ncbi:Manganese transport system membrane protein MntC [Candidatus Promineifilum breve]|uniref:Manganese transport system membrane protein MntC n=1 Tax=Candidatus Promineifilum breve TaxID=1806508 RepID=A0A161KAW0_9CHLR|nr:metal ABC transporter permease [Candidatus Promineifilum breve]CUS04433.2 Manganese transport system membrane protein MntC [Candidatus Promineifilum breve]